ncbi:hypothetical protein L596_028595 [Steinernema carpocapsae]|uniref:Uncharacterized protein n=1 Tax=Steinernema carpocapsae TaxID=34508 RepID=A0A4U5LYV1_STECR|nr:hypothetical protein L596_028595 [Steinernema carpocapsae]
MSPKTLFTLAFFLAVFFQVRAFPSFNVKALHPLQLFEEACCTGYIACSNLCHQRRCNSGTCWSNYGASCTNNCRCSGCR